MKKEDASMEEPKMESSESKPESSMKKESGSSNKNTMMAFAIGVVVLLILGLVAVFSLLQNAGSGGSYSADSGVEEINPYVEDNVDIFLDAMDFNEFDPENPLDFIDFAAIGRKTEDSANKLRYLSSPTSEDVQFVGNTFHEVLEMDMTVDVNGEEMSLNGSFEFFIQYDEDYDASKYEAKTAADAMNLIQNLSNEDFTDLLASVDYFIEGQMDLGSTTGSLDTEFQLTIVDRVAYLLLENFNNDGIVPPEDLEGISEIVGKTVKVDANESLSELFSIYSDSLAGVDADQLSSFSDLENFKDTEEYRELNEELAASFATMSEEDIKLIKSAGPKIKRSISENFNNLEFFTNISEIEPIREGTDSVCYNGEFNTEGLLNSVREVILDSYDIVTSDSNFGSEGMDVAEQREQLVESFEEFKVITEFFEMNLTACHDAFEKYNTGIGFFIDYTAFGTGITFDLNTLTISHDADRDITAPEAELDYTEQFNELLSGFSSLYESSLTNSYDLGDYETDFDSGEFDDLNQEISPEEDELLNKFLNEEITFEEYMAGLEALYAE